MKKTLISASLALAFIGSAHAQSPLAAKVPAAAPAQVSAMQGTQAGQAALQSTSSNGPAAAPAPVQSSGNLKPSAASANPFTGVTKTQEADERSLTELQAQSLISQQKLKLQRDEIDALKLEVEKRKYIDQLNPPAPPKPAPVQSSAPVVKKKQVKEVKPAVIIGPSRTKNSRPEVVGVIETAGHKVALIQHDGKSLRAQVGSVVAGKPVTQISAENIQWGGEYISVSAGQDLATVELTDTESPKSRKQAAGNSVTRPQAPAPAAQAPTGPRQVPVINPRGATINSNGSTNPSGVFGNLPPPPPNISTR